MQRIGRLWIQLPAVALLAVLSALPLLAPQQAWAQAGAAKTSVGANEKIMDIAKRIRYPNATLNQMALALVRANPGAFALRSERQLIPGAEIIIPAEPDVLATDPATADREISRLAKADALYRTAVVAERKGDMPKAMRAYLTAAHMGHALADHRLGQLYDWDPTGKVPHDLAESIAFYQSARKRGVKVEGPLRREPPVTGR